MVVVNHHDPDKQKKVKISKLYEFDGLQKVEVKEASIGAIVAISGISDISIGDTPVSYTHLFLIMDAKRPLYSPFYHYLYFNSTDL